DYYNNKRIKEKLHWMSPIQFREARQEILSTVPA
ncbi:IS3 family transposase, partial [Desertibacillus haloalkaliphilus]|nr:IS3 family transposase [Desertibacillus haloalkaliphilus]